MLIEASAMKVRQNLGELISQVQYANAVVEITKSDKPVAALINIDLFKKIQLMEKELNRLSIAAAKAFKDEDPKEIEKIIKEAIKKSRTKKLK